MKKCPDCKGKKWKIVRITKFYQCSRCGRVREETKKVLNWKEKDAIYHRKDNKKYKRLGKELLNEVLR